MGHERDSGRSSFTKIAKDLTNDMEMAVLESSFEVVPFLPTMPHWHPAILKGVGEAKQQVRNVLSFFHAVTVFPEPPPHAPFSSEAHVLIETWNGLTESIKHLSWLQAEERERVARLFAKRRFLHSASPVFMSLARSLWPGEPEWLYADMQLPDASVKLRRFEYRYHMHDLIRQEVHEYRMGLPN